MSVTRRESEARFHAGVAALAPWMAVVPWSAPTKAQPHLDLFAAGVAARRGSSTTTDSSRK